MSLDARSWKARAERAESAHARLVEAMKSLQDEGDGLKAEVERLKERQRKNEWVDLNAEDLLRRENERLRRALEWYADTHHIYLLREDPGVRQQLYTHAFVSHIFLKEVETGKRAREALSPRQAP